MDREQFEMAGLAEFLREGLVPGEPVTPDKIEQVMRASGRLVFIQALDQAAALAAADAAAGRTAQEVAEHLAALAAAMRNSD